MTLRRYLDDYEAAYSRMDATNAVEYQGRLDGSTLRDAFALLCTHYPVLRARICRDEHGLLLDVPEEHDPAVTVTDGDETTLRHVATKTLDMADTVAQLIAIRGKSKGYVGLRVNHAIADFGAYFVLFNELWQLYSDLARGHQIAITPVTSLPRPPCEIFQQRWRGIQSIITARPRMPVGEIEFCAPLYRHIKFSRRDTDQLVAAARRHEISVNALLSGAIMLALYKHGLHTAPTPMKIRSVVDLRNRATPPVGATETTNFHLPYITTVTVHPDSDAIAVGRDMKRELDGALTRRDVFTPKFAAKNSFAINNIGAIPRFPQSDDLRITGFLAHQDAKIPTKSVGGERIWTYEGQLNIDGQYPSIDFTSEALKQIAELMVLQLGAAISSDPTVEVTTSVYEEPNLDNG